MSASATARLVSLGGNALVLGPPSLTPETERLGGRLVLELLDLLAKKNGFYAFESSLHVFPAGQTAAEMALDLWNSPGLWRDAYGRLADDGLFFAEDVFGVQFSLLRDAVYRFDPESGDFSGFADSVEQWARRIVDDYDTETGYALSHSWQARPGPLRPGTRLFAKYPFVPGGNTLWTICEHSTRSRVCDSSAISQPRSTTYRTEHQSSLKLLTRSHRARLLCLRSHVSWRNACVERVSADGRNRAARGDETERGTRECGIL